MTTTNAMDTDAAVAQSIRMIDAVVKLFSAAQQEGSRKSSKYKKWLIKEATIHH